MSVVEFSYGLAVYVQQLMQLFLPARGGSHPQSTFSAYLDSRNAQNGVSQVQGVQLHAPGFELLRPLSGHIQSLWCQPAITRPAVSAGFGWVTASLVQYRRFVSLVNITVGSLTMV